MALSVDEIVEQVGKMNGNLAAVARSFGVTRQAIYKRMKDSALIKAAMEEARESMLDNAESVLYRKVLNGDTAELIFFLKTQGKKRGYVERGEWTGKDGDPLLDFAAAIRALRAADQVLNGDND